MCAGIFSPNLVKIMILNTEIYFYRKVNLSWKLPLAAIKTKAKHFFPDSSVGKESACNAGDPGFIPGSGRSTGEWKGYPLQYSGLENSMDCIDHGVAELDTTERISLRFTSNIDAQCLNGKHSLFPTFGKILHNPLNTSLLFLK